MSSGFRKAASRYTSFDSQTSSTSSSEFKSICSNPKANAIVKLNSANKIKTEHNFASMVKKFMEKRTISTKNSGIVPALPKKLFGRGSDEKKAKAKALTEVKTNTRTLAMVLRSERELLSFTKDQEAEITELKSLLQERNLEVEKLKNLCLKQREEIKALKSAVLFPDEMNSQLQEILEKQGSELVQARQVIPTLQRQISSLTGQLQCLSEDLAEVKAVKYSANFSSPTTPIYDQQQSANSLDFSDDDPTTPDSPDDMLLKDVNPCLTPCFSKTKSREYGISRCDYIEQHVSRRNTTCANIRRSDQNKYKCAN